MIEPIKVLKIILFVIIKINKSIEISRRNLSISEKMKRSRINFRLKQLY